MVGATFSINLSRVRPGVDALLLLGTSNSSWQGAPLPLDLAPFGMPGCLLRTSIEAQLAFRASGTGSKGFVVAPLPVPNDPSLRGARFYAQWIVTEQDATGLFRSMTRALALQIQ
jgi:hypothetical protein